MAVTPGKEVATKGDGAKKRSPSFAVSNSQCKICKLDPKWRRQFENMITMGMQQVDVMRHWNEILETMGDGAYPPDYLNENNVSNHVRRHMSARETAVRKIVESKVKEFVGAVEDQEAILMSKEAALDVVIATGVANIARGATYVEPRELVNAVALKANLEAETGNVATDELWRQFLAFQDAVKVVVTPEQRELIAQTFEKNLQMTAPKELAATTVTTHIEAIEVTEEVPNDLPQQGDTK